MIIVLYIFNLKPLFLILCTIRRGAILTIYIWLEISSESGRIYVDIQLEKLSKSLSPNKISIIIDLKKIQRLLKLLLHIGSQLGKIKTEVHEQFSLLTVFLVYSAYFSSAMALLYIHDLIIYLW